MAKLTTKQRAKLSTGEFAIPSERKYPIDTRARAANALARVEQFGDSDEKAEVRRAVRRKYPGLQKSHK